MARTISEISDSITAALQSKLSLSASTVAEWLLWVSVVATAIHTFELILDQFKREISERVLKAYPGTQKWYVEQCFLFQNGHELIFDETTAQIGYAADDPASRIVAVAAVQIVAGTIIIRVAKSAGGEIVPLSAAELLNFKNYIDEIKPAGVKTTAVSTTADRILYTATVYYDPAYPVELIQSGTAAALEAFKTAQTFGGVVYPARFADALMAVDGVVTVKITSFKRKGTSDTEYQMVDVSAQLEAGYFNYDEDSTINYLTINELPV